MGTREAAAKAVGARMFRAKATRSQPEGAWRMCYMKTTKKRNVLYSTQTTKHTETITQKVRRRRLLRRRQKDCDATSFCCIIGSKDWNDGKAFQTMNQTGMKGKGLLNN